jgi:hypothetical protein
MARKSYNVSLDNRNWDFLYGSGEGSHPNDASVGWDYDFQGEPHYLTHSFTKSLTEKYNLTITGTLTVSSPVWDTSMTGGGTAYATVMVRKKKDNALTDGNGRFWCNTDRLNLETTSGAFTLDISLDPDNWSNVDGKKHSKAFKSLLKSNLGSVGLTFGATFYGHGIQLSSGTAVLNVTKFKFT